MAPLQGQRQTNPWEQNLFHKHKSSVHLHTPSKSLPPPPPHLITFYRFSTFKYIRDLSCPCRKIVQGHPTVSIYINFVKLYCLMHHAKFQNRRPSGSGEEDFYLFILFFFFFFFFAIYSHGSNLGNLT